MTKTLYDEFGLQMHFAFSQLCRQPSDEHFCSLGTIMNVVNIAIDKDKKFDEDRIYLNSGINMMTQIGNKCVAGLPLKDYEMECIKIALNRIDDILPYIDVTKLHLANMTLKGLR
tara:strand:+ start:214 stop:558 length:345 start_codon:yes stop_codon:yes gene_type:complete